MATVKVIGACYTIISKVTDNWISVFRGVILVGFWISLFYLLYMVYPKWGFVGYFYIAVSILSIEFFHFVGGGHSP